MIKEILVQMETNLIFTKDLSFFFVNLFGNRFNCYEVVFYCFYEISCGIIQSE